MNEDFYVSDEVHKKFMEEMKPIKEELEREHKKIVFTLDMDDFK